MRIQIPFLLLACVLCFGCGNNGTQRVASDSNPQPEKQHEKQPAAQTGEQPEVAVAPQPRQPRIVLETLLTRADKIFKTAPEEDPLERLSAMQYGVAQELLIIARALDAEGEHTTIIEEYTKRFSQDTTDPLGVRLTNSMMGIYTGYTILYTMRFNAQPEKLEKLSKWREEIDKLIKKNDLIINPLSKMAGYSYQMLKEILRDIDHQNRLEPAFRKSDSLYTAGNHAAASGEDRYLNTTYRLFELSQVWALQLDVNAQPKVEQIKQGFHNSLLSSQTIGEQMVAAMEYEYILLRLVTNLTFDSMYQQTGQ